MDNPSEYVIVFSSTNVAIKAEQCLLEHGMKVSVMPLPSQIKAGCGICLRTSPDNISAALEALANVQISEIGLYARKGSAYAKTDFTDG
ncbi:MAG: DUF3343 domain-containing protein [Oscillospiraceae bacterium]|nr:DUF3343 domain-containing protein [Oscillospiraceae bacterium]MCL2279992.1 DUF3343 domain-containing protein [Oscillospiraceae bacterium]